MGPTRLDKLGGVLSSPKDEAEAFTGGQRPTEKKCRPFSMRCGAGAAGERYAPITRERTQTPFSRRWAIVPNGR